ncbi:MAG: type II toxin-antitoxin system HicB family antitoxin [Terriglobia bacterium]
MRNKRVKEFNVVIERDTEGYYLASVPALPGCHTQAKSLDKLVERIQEAIELCLEVRHQQIEPLEFIGVQKITVGQ